MALTFGTYPHPGFADRLITNKPEGIGWNNLGKRVPFAVVLHRMYGSLVGTDIYFHDPRVKALTDYGVGVAAMDGPSLNGVIYRWVDPRGYVTPWASGPVSAPYGGGLCFINKFGYSDAANKNAVSIEISGKEETPIDDFALGEIVALSAYWIDQMKIPWDRLPTSPITGCDAFIWHEEFTYGTGKRCPFSLVKALTDDIIGATIDALRPYQTGGDAPAPVPVPPPDEEDPLADIRKSGYTLDPATIWPNVGKGAVATLWREYGEATGIWNPPGQPWNDDGGQGCKLYQFEGGPLIALDSKGEAGIVVKHE